MRHLLNLLCIAVLCVGASGARSRVVELQIDSRSLVAEGASFGSAGPYEKLRGWVRFEVNPDDPANAGVFDIGNAPRNARGMVEFSAEMYLLKPLDLGKANGALFFEVNNRGRKVSFGRFHETASDANMNDPSSMRDFGNAFLLRRGYVLAWIGWGADIAPGDNRLTVRFPLVGENSGMATQKIITEYSDRNFNGQFIYTLPLSGGAAFNSFPTVSTDPVLAAAELRERTSDSSKESGAGIPQGTLISAKKWSFARCPDGPPGESSATDICFHEGFLHRLVYQLTYQATGSPVMGLGYLTTRDFVSFLRYAATDDRGTPNPVAGMRLALCEGISSSGMYLRDFLYQGFNEDEAGRRVCDGMHIHVAGAHKLYLNYRFAQPNPFTQQHRERYVPDLTFPRTYQVRRDPMTGVDDGILKRPRTDPKIIHTDSSNEYWQMRASLVGTDETGSTDLVEPPSVRRYLLSSTQHGWFKGDPPGYGLANRQCQQLTNPTHQGPHLRALLVALDQWVRDDKLPPDSRVPRIADGSLVAPEKLAFPELLGVAFQGRHNGSAERDFGPRVRRNAGIVDKLLPDVLTPHRVLVPQVDALGNEIAGVRHPVVQVPIATLTGWNTRRPEFGLNDLCDLQGSMIRLPRTEFDREDRGDPRSSVQELYGDHRGYMDKLAAAAGALVTQGLLLAEDVAPILQEAEENSVLR